MSDYDFDIGGGFDEEPEEFDMDIEDNLEEQEPETIDQSLDQSTDQSAVNEPARKRAKTDFDHCLSMTAKMPNEESWLRPAVDESIDLSQPMDCQNLEADYYLSGNSRLFEGFDDPFNIDQSVKRAVVRLFGVDAAGHSIMLHIHNFMPYFYIAAWPGFGANGNNDLGPLGEALSDEIKSRDRAIVRPVIGLEVVQRQSIWGYHTQATQPFIRITMSSPLLIPQTRKMLERGISLGGLLGRRSFLTYESNLPYVLRFMVDMGVAGAGWLSVQGGKYEVRPQHKKVSRCQIELDCDYRAIVARDVNDPKWLHMAPMRVLSFDIECAGRQGFFPTPDQDPVIQIACALSSTHSIKDPIAQVVFTLKGCSPIVGAQVICSDTEEQLLMKFLRFWLLADPDLITGYNMINFDLPYLIDRAKKLKLNDFPYFGRIYKSISTVKNSKFESKAFGIRENKEIKMEGRVQLDCLDVIRREYKLRSYTLNSVSAHFLGQQKEDVHYSIISDLQNGTDETRHRLAVYCLKDALLPLRLMDSLMLAINLMEMARVTGVSIIYLLTRGQQIKVISQLYRAARKHQLVIPVRQDGKSDDKYEGATVIEPKKAYYTQPIATLDFASLYPSIMMAHNLCYSTLIAPADVANMPADSYVKTPTGDHFVKSSVKAGLLPEILRDLLGARASARAQMKNETDPLRSAVLNGRQLALKISANSVYGFTGAQVGQLPCLAISSSVTGFGRDMIMDTKHAVERQFTRANGYANDADVVYGDTDSVMVRFGCDDVGEAMKLGAEAAAFVTQQFLDPIRLEFEKVYYPYLLMNKKRYAGLYWTNPLKWDKMDTKGIETVRRDNCALVSNVVTTCLNEILIHRNPEASIEYVKRTIADLLCNRLDLSLLVISKSLGKSAASEGYSNKQAHVELAERMRKRDPRSAPAVGDRVAYVITKAAKGVPAYDRAEDPIYVLENSLPIDTAYYLTNQLQQPLQRLFEPILNPTQLKSLFAGSHTRQIKVSTPASGGIMKFAIKNKTCLGCKVPLSEGEGEFCQHCEERKPELYLLSLDAVREHEELFSRTWTQCQSCQGSLHLDVLCTSRDCPIFYRRKKVQKDLDQAQKILERFEF